jgi:maleylpyruvate isomerase
MADVFLVPQVWGARRWGVDVSAFPRVLAAEAAALAEPHAAAWTPEALQKRMG